jgi:hypothetical protein
MQLHYNIIWIDDEIKKFEEVGDLNRIIEYLKDLGFTPFILSLTDGKEIETYFSNNKFDLILSDFSIEDGHHGDDIIKAIRNNNIFTEVLFYTSQQNELENIAKKLLTVDRISFHSGRRGLLDKIENLISLSVAKLLELNATRGLITAETSELDVTIETIVMNLVFDKLKLDQAKLDEIINFYVDDFLRKSPDSFMKKYSEVGFKSWFHRIEANRKWGIFRDLLNTNPTEEVKQFLQQNKTYGDDVIAVRNKFAHSKAINKEQKLYLAGFGPDGNPFEFDEVECISIRKKLIEHRENFNELLQHLGI